MKDIYSRRILRAAIVSFAVAIAMALLLAWLA